METPDLPEASDITIWKTCATCNNFLDACLCPDSAVATLASVPELEPGEVIGGHYQVIRLLGRGGMSSVYLCRHMITDELFAIKMLNESVSLDIEARKRFDREALAMANLFHPNLVALKGHGHSDSGQTYFVMDFLDGKSLALVLNKDGALETQRAIALFLQIASAMSHAHAAGIVHRDLKPGNIFILPCPDGAEQVKVLDFGIARLDRAPSELKARLTQRGQVLGSPRYMSPEQCLGAPLDSRTDIYSLGCVMYQVLAGAPPFDGEHSVAILYKQVNEPVPAFTGGIVPGALSNIVLRALQKDPAERYQNMDEIIIDLRKCALER